jgi:hypothetical protein
MIRDHIAGSPAALLAAAGFLGHMQALVAPQALDAFAVAPPALTNQ